MYITGNVYDVMTGFVKIEHNLENTFISGNQPRQDSVILRDLDVTPKPS